MHYQELALSFRCQGDSLYGVLSLPERPAARGVLIVVGGPQYRVGSHRQFALLARALAEQGVAALRFDYRGMGDSEGEARDFEMVDADLRVAVDQLMAAVPGLQDVVIWGLCDAASAALFYAHQDERVRGLVLVNPWARTDSGLAKTTLKHYYRERLMDPALWKKIARGQFEFGKAGRAMLRLVGAAYAGKPAAATQRAPLTQRMQHGIARFNGKVLLIICGADLTGQEFMEMAHASREWRALLAAPRVTQKYLAGADHTFSRRVWRDQIASWTGDWLRAW